MEIKNPNQTLDRCRLSSARLEEMYVLTGLGLSSRQARLYLALLNASVFKASLIARLARIPRREAYTLLFELEQLGIVKPNLTVPDSYGAVPFAEAMKLLLKRKTEQFADLKEPITKGIVKDDVPQS